MIWTKGAYQSAKFQTFNYSHEISPNLYSDKLLLVKVYKVLTKKVQRSYVSWHWIMMQVLNKNWFVVSKMTKIWWILTRVLKSLKNLQLDWFLLCKVYKVWPKKVQRSYLSWHSRLMQNFKKNLTWGLKNDMKHLANFHRNTQKSKNLCSDGILLSKVENVWA